MSTEPMRTVPASAVPVSAEGRASEQFVRPHIASAPLAVVAAVERISGSALAHEMPAASGYTKSVASTITLGSGERVFVKAGRCDDGTAAAVQAGAELAAVIGDLGPPLRGAQLVDGWAVAVYEVIAGAPLERWDHAATEALADMSEKMRSQLDPSPIADTEPFANAFAPLLGAWHALSTPQHPDAASVAHVSDRPLPYGLDAARLAELEARWHEALEQGEALQHGDIRRDNVVREPSGKLWLVDWTHKWTAPGWVDLVRVAPDIAASGGDPEHFLRSTVWSDAPSDSVNVLLAGLAGRCWRDGHRADVPGLPQLRPMQREQGDATLRWLADRLSTSP